MKDWLTFSVFLGLLIVGCFALSAFRTSKENGALLSNLDHVLRQSDVSNRDSLLQELHFQQFQEDYYIQQLGREHDRLMAYMTILAGFVALFSFASFYWQVEKYKGELEVEIKKIKEENSTHKTEQIELHTKVLAAASNAHVVAGMVARKANRGFAFRNVLAAIELTMQQLDLNPHQKETEGANKVVLKRLTSAYIYGTEFLQLADSKFEAEYEEQILPWEERLEDAIITVVAYNNREIADKAIQVRELIKQQRERFQRLKDASAEANF